MMTAIAVITVFMTTACGSGAGLSAVTAKSSTTARPVADASVLRDSISSADGIGTDGYTGASITGDEISDTKLMNLVATHFNAVTFGNELKPDCLFGYHDGSRTNPGTETISFTFADGTTDDSFVVPKLDYSRAERMLNRIMELNEVDPDHQIKVRGHVLVWHSQTPGMVHCNGPAAFYRKKQQI